MKAYKNAFVEEAEERGLEKGIEQGIEQGIEKTNLAVALKMIKENAQLEFISKVTGLSLKKLKELKKGHHTRK